MQQQQSHAVSVEMWEEDDGIQLANELRERRPEVPNDFVIMGLASERISQLLDTYDGHKIWVVALMSAMSRSGEPKEIRVTGTEIKVATDASDPITPDTRRMLTGENTLLCSFLTWAGFPADLTVHIDDDGNVGTTQPSREAAAAYYLYRIRHEGNEILVVVPAETLVDEICSGLGIRSETACIRRSPVVSHRNIDWRSDWCTGGQNPDRVVAKQITESTGLPTVLCNVVAGYYNFGEYTSINTYRQRVLEEQTRRLASKKL